ncbi:MAG: NigD-like N-terminal domain-containing protein [Prevotella sp.]|nr:NigD-like N-terminal domain-containing protein [Prevotella sp.]MBR1556585.1 NigD-like N-terminal domain-containing protein [Prevotella sp.]
MKQIIAFVVVCLMCGCTQDAYDKGEGKYSLMRGDFAEAVVDGSKNATKIITDDGDELMLSTPYTAKWISKADTTYRCMLYYNKVDNKAEVISMGQVPCPSVVPLSEFNKALTTDPVKFESSWISKTGRYLNLSLLVKTGVTDDTEAAQSLAIVSDTLITHPDSKQIRHLVLHHDQAGVPQYYSTQVYLSIPVARIDADSVRISINSYDGEVVVKHRCR